MSTPLPYRAVFWALVAGVILLLVALVTPSFGRVSSQARRTVDASNLRQIGQAALLYASDHNDNLPATTDIWDYARILAEETGLHEPLMWQSKNDPASDDNVPPPRSILVEGASKPRPLDPAFRQFKPSVAVALGKLHTRMPYTTPIAWTRGLRPDGTWSPHSPYGESGGYIVFLGGNISFYKDLKSPGSQLLRFDGKGPTANILEALPADTRIGEYTPTDEEKTAWAESIRLSQKLGSLHKHFPVLALAGLWIPFVAIGVFRLLKKRPGAFTVLIWPVILTALLFVILPGSW